MSDPGAVGVVHDALQWDLKLSTTGQTKTTSLGTVGDTILSGCRFSANKGSSVAVFRGSNRELV
jgi:hypothetical protein